MFFGLDAVAAALLRALGVHFPSAVAGMLVCFFGMLGLRSLAPSMAERLAALLAPGARWLGRWMALFFVPPLVLLPLTPLPSAPDLVRMAVLLGAGFVLVLVATAWVARSFGAPAVAAAARSTHVGGWSVPALWCFWLGIGLLGWALEARSSLAALALGVALSVLGFMFGEQLRARLFTSPWPVLANLVHPVVFSAVCTCWLWQVLGHPLRQYLLPAGHTLGAGNVLMACLGPAVVALGLSLDAQRSLLRKGAAPLFASTLFAALFSLFTSAALARVLGLPSQLGRAFIPRSVTTPIALSIADLLHAEPGLTAALVITTGVLGALFALPLLRRLGFRSSFVVGVATGAASHGIGTAALVREEPAAAALSGISFALTATASVLLVSVPQVRAALAWLLG